MKVYKGWCVVEEGLYYFPFKTDRSTEFLYKIYNNNGTVILYVYPDTSCAGYEYKVYLGNHFEDPFNPTLEELVMFGLEFNVSVEILREGLQMYPFKNKF